MASTSGCSALHATAAITAASCTPSHLLASLYSFDLVLLPSPSFLAPSISMSLLTRLTVFARSRIFCCKTEAPSRTAEASEGRERIGEHGEDERAGGSSSRAREQQEMCERASLAGSGGEISSLTRCVDSL
ncbi:uncharacterized protein SCHCODRAFT_02620451 [Schizophyllum commune H4-8]|uniref:uncharacterized protein n=1 Tax=Schizophyllum commune (strain H4-8 / FGSC 9210) TaxID=578458 RepID=UPI00215E5E4C|nr:uncharacterized protein SCHCODRAFT_02620438 [Schizophyllum commune H4-8]XP_050201400.1 uncharacterized protein SCHCODRAFT_02620451 [Schizophyllum commune H4-8]KAI5895856.1 hypothetical protein SCHCODRAFT_02620438 [Schizophyllum commune H4-8]KAI5895862.1 hypothetical protein SCHCODRAFT_02620451 [Schizophyllum commune H4-8]